MIGAGPDRRKLGNKLGGVWLNAGAGSPELLAEARRLGLNVIVGCSIAAPGLSPAQFPDT